MSLPIPSLPSGSGVFTLSSASYSLALPNTVTSGNEDRDGTVYHAEVVGKGGTVLNRTQTLDAIEVELSGVLFSESDVATVKKIVGQGRVTVSREGLTLEGGVTGYRVRERVLSELWDFRLTVLANDYYWTGASVTSANNPTSVTNSGDLVTPPTLTITGGTGGATEASVSIGGSVATYTGPIGAGSVLVIECDTLGVTLDGSGVLGGMNSSFFTSPIGIVPGSNVVGFTVTGAADLVVSYQERYL